LEKDPHLFFQMVVFWHGDLPWDRIRQKTANKSKEGGQPWRFSKMLPSDKAITSNRLLAVCPDGTNFSG